MARKSKPLTPLQQEYRKQRRRIQQFVRRAEKRGYQFKENVIPNIPKKITKQSVERLRKLTPEKLYKKAVYGGEASYGEIVKGTKGVELERKAKAQKARETRKAREALHTPISQEPYKPIDYQPDTDYDYDTDIDYDYNDYYGDNEEDFNIPVSISQDASFYERVILESFRSTARQFAARDYILNWLNSCIATYGEHETAQMIQRAAEAGLILGLTVRPSDREEVIASFLSEMLNYMAEAGDFSREQMMEMMESMESYEPVT